MRTHGSGSLVALWCARHVLTDPAPPPHLADALLASHPAGARAHALGVVPDDALDQDRLSRLLLDASGAGGPRPRPGPVRSR